MNLRIWRLMALVAALALVVGTTSCSPGDSTQQGEAEATVEDTAAAPQMQWKVPLDTYVAVLIGEPESLDPAWTYETTGAGYEANLYDSLLYFNREKPDDFVPALAEDWSLSDDQLVYTFNIRDGVRFHEGGTLEPHDIAYSLQRAMLQDREAGPMWLYLEPLLGTSSIEALALEQASMTDLEEAKLVDVPADVAVAVCESVKQVVSADDEAGTVTIRVLQPTPWLLQLLAQPWASALDSEWMAEQGDWDGSCDTWVQFNKPEKQETVLFDQANGTGPYKLGLWKKGEEITLEANEDYWRTEPIWEGGPSGAPRIKHLVFRKAEEWGSRLTMLSAGDADAIDVPRAQIGQLESLVHTVYEGPDESAPSEVLNPQGTLKLFKGYPTASSTVAMFTQAINEQSEFIGSGQLDGEGIPVDFFADLHVRKAFNYCFDWETYLREGLQGEGFQLRGPIIEGLLGYRPDSPVYALDLDQCREEMALAWDGKVAETGFKMTLVYNEGNDTRKMAAEILAENLAIVDPAYQITVQELEWPSFLAARNDEKLPIAISGWLEDYHDASNWVHPFMHSNGAYAGAQHFDDELQARIDELIDEAVLETDATRRDELYAELQTLAYDNALDIFLEQATGRAYRNRQVVGWYYNPLTPGDWYYAFGKEDVEIGQ